MERRWQKVAVAALAVYVLGGLVPLWPDVVRIACLLAGVLLLGVALVLRRRTRKSRSEPARDWGGPNDSAYDPARNTEPDRSPRPDHRWPGIGGL